VCVWNHVATASVIETLLYIHLLNIRTFWTTENIDIDNTMYSKQFK